MKEPEITKRIFDKVTKPFLIEPFCAQVAWIDPCPVYPFSTKPELACKYITSSNYDENYRCPQISSVMEIAQAIISKGTEEQKKSLEFLADMFANYGLKETPGLIKERYCIGDSIAVYRALGLNEKAKRVEDESNRILNERDSQSPYSP